MLAGVSRRRLGHVSRRRDDGVAGRLDDLAASNPRYGCRRLWAVEVEHRMNAKCVARTLLKLFGERGTPLFVRSDNGPEFVARFLMRVLAIHGIGARHIDPGSPWQNGCLERFNGSLRDECLKTETFHNSGHARALIKRYEIGRAHV